MIEPFTFCSRGETSKAEHTLPLHYLSECTSCVGILIDSTLHGFCFQWGQGAADKEAMFSASENPTERTPDTLQCQQISVCSLDLWGTQNREWDSAGIWSQFRVGKLCLSFLMWFLRIKYLTTYISYTHQPHPCSNSTGNRCTKQETGASAVL